MTCVSRRVVPLLAFVIAQAWPAPPSARGLDYGLVTAPGVQACDAQRWGAQRGTAVACYRQLLAQQDPAVRAEAAWALGDFKSANEWFRDALRVHADKLPDSVALRVRWGELYIDSHQDSEAYKLFQEALKRDPANAWAHADEAMVLVGGYSKEAAAALDAVLGDESAPAGAQLRARLLQVRVALENGELDDAAEKLQLASALATAGKMPTLEVVSLQASLDQLRGSDPAARIEAVLREKPGYGEIYATLAHFNEIRRRYDEATAQYRKAIEIQPDLWDARVDLATGFLRDNRASEARAQLEEAFKGDPYNPVTANTLRLLDSLSKFDTLVYPQADEKNAGAMPQIIVRVNRKESAVLAPYVRRLAEQAMKEYSQRYRYQLTQPVVIEIYNNHEDFAVRTAGMPGLGLLGVTFGHVLAMDSPSSRAVNEFHWGSTLWHELAHVYTLESTHHRVPRWLSEGLSVHEEWSTGPIKGVSIPGYAFKAFADGKALPIADLDRGFIRPEYEQQVQVSYMQAGLVCEFIAKRWGAERLVRMLGEYDRGANTTAAVQAALGIKVDEFDRLFGEWMRQEYGAVFAGLRAWSEARVAAIKAARAKEWTDAISEAQRALKVLPIDVEDGSPYVPLAEAQFALKQDAAARDTLTAYWQRGGHDPQALGRLASEYQAAGRKNDALAVMESIEYVAPFDYNQHGQYGDWLMEANRPADALMEFQVALALNPQDLALANYRLAHAYLALQRNAEARSAVLRSLEVAPSYRPSQQLLLELARGPGKS
jgi:tetratricopeptide (TPR) repeat protein